MDDWVAFQQSLAVQPVGQDEWDPGFEGERRVVLSKIGPYTNLFPRPEKFVKRFYHTVYYLAIEDWKIATQTTLYSGFCTINGTLNIRFQPTLRYVEENLEALPDIGSTIKSHYEGIVRDIIDTALLDLDDGSWVQTGLSETQKQIEITINETLILQNIQGRALCVLEPYFKPLTNDDETTIDGKFTQESIYINVIKKNFAFHENQDKEKLRQQEALEKSRLEQLRLEEESQRQKQAQEAEAKVLRLEEEKEQRTKQHEVKERLHIEKIKHKTRLMEMELQAEIADQAKLQAERFQMEDKLHTEKIKHDAQLKELELETKRSELAKQSAEELQIEEEFRLKKLQHDARLKERDLQAEIDEHAKQQAKWHEVEERLRKEKISHDSALKEMDLAAELKEQKKRFDATQQTDDYLRKEIETLVLEKQRAELNREIREAEKKAGPAPQESL